MTNTKYTDYKFSCDGINFISRVYHSSPLIEQISQLPEAIFIGMNIAAIKELIGDVSLLTKAELLSELAVINDVAEDSVD